MDPVETSAEENSSWPPDFRSTDPFRVLGLRPGASAAAVRRAYLDLIKRHHPDRAACDLDTEIAAAINQAFQALGPTFRRAGAEPSHNRPARPRSVVLARPSRPKHGLYRPRPPRGRLFALLAVAALAAAGYAAWFDGSGSETISTSPPTGAPAGQLQREFALGLDWLSREIGIGAVEPPVANVKHAANDLSPTPPRNGDAGVDIIDHSRAIGGASGLQTPGAMRGIIISGAASDGRRTTTLSSPAPAS